VVRSNVMKRIDSITPFRTKRGKLKGQHHDAFPQTGMINKNIDACYAYTRLFVCVE